MSKKTMHNPLLLCSLWCVFIFGTVAFAEEFENRTDKPPVGHTDPGKYHESLDVHGGAGSIRYMELLGGEDFETNFLFVHRGVIPPKSGIGEHLHRKMEEMYIIFDGTARFTVNGHTSILPAGSMVLCPMGSSHGIYNHTDRDIQWMNIAVGSKRGKYDVINFNDDLVNVSLESPPRFLQAELDRRLLHTGSNAHEGKGDILFRRIWSDDSFTTNWYVVSHAVLPPGSSIGYHQHNTREEVYYIISGKGRLTANGHTFDVRKGDAVPCRLHGSHGIYNNADDDLELLVFSVAIKKNYVKYEKNRGDDLTGR